MTDPYFEEFIPLLNPNGVGVRGYRADFGMKSYFNQDQHLSVDIRVYLMDLLQHAQNLGRQPVLKFTRALARAEWLRATFPDALQILLLRSPAAQFSSGYRQAAEMDNFTFLMIPLWALTQVKHHSVAELLARLPAPVLPSDSDVASLATAYGKAARDLTMAQSVSVFISFYVLSHWFSKDFADITIELERLQSDKDFTNAVTRVILERSGLNVNFSSISRKEEWWATGRDNAPDASDFQEAAHATLDVLEDDYPASVEYTRRRLLA